MEGRWRHGDRYAPVLTLGRHPNKTATPFHHRKCWMLHSGVISEGALGRVRTYLLRLKGMLRSLPLQTPNREDALVAAVDALLSTDRPTQETLIEFETRASSSVVRLNRGKGARKGGAGFDDEGDAGDDAPYGLSLAIVICKLSAHLQRSMLGDQLLRYYIEWCSTPFAAEPGICFRDTCLKFGVGGVPCVFVSKGPQQNLYFWVDRPLLDPVLPAAQERVQKFLSQTFYRTACPYSTLGAGRLNVFAHMEHSGVTTSVDKLKHNHFSECSSRV